MAKPFDATPSDVGLEPWPTENGWPKFIPCDNCGAASLAIVDTPDGCVALPGQKRLHMCGQHLTNWGFLQGDGAGIKLVAEVGSGMAAWAGWPRG